MHYYGALKQNRDSPLLLLIELQLVLEKPRTKIEIGYSHYYDILDTELLHSLQSVVLKRRTPEQVIATTWEPLQSLISLLEQERTHNSFPEQSTSSSQIWLEPDISISLQSKWCCDKATFWWHFNHPLYLIIDWYTVHHWSNQPEVYSSLFGCLLLSN